MTNKDKEIKAPEVDLFGEVDLELKESIISTNKLKKTELRKLESDRAALIGKEAIKIQKRHINKELMSLAKVRLESLQSSELKELKKLNVEVMPKDLTQVMTLLALSNSPYGELSKQDIIKYFDNQCNFLRDVEVTEISQGPPSPSYFKTDNSTWKMSPYDPCSCLYQWFYRIDDESIGGTDYKNNKLDISQIYILQVEMFIKIFDVMNDCCANYDDEVGDEAGTNERLNVPSQRSAIKKLLDIGLILYPHEFKKILNAGTQYLDDRNGPNIVASDQNGILHFKLLNRPNVFLNIFNNYDREEVIRDYIEGGLILEAFGLFTAKTPKNLHCFFESRFSANISQRLSKDQKYKNEPEWDRYWWITLTPRAKRYREVGYAWNDGQFGPFEYTITKEFVSIKWKYPKFFKLDSIADIEADHTFLFEHILSHEGGTKDYPIPPYDAEYRGGKI